MAVIDYSRLNAAHRGGVFSRLTGSLRSWNDARLTRKALTSLSARELDDIGLAPGDIERVARR